MSKKKPPIPYKDITLEKIQQVTTKYFKDNVSEADDCFVKKLTPDEVEHTHKMAGSLTRNMGSELYRLPGGAITGPGGLQMFYEEVIKVFNKTLN